MTNSMPKGTKSIFYSSRRVWHWHRLAVVCGLWSDTWALHKIGGASPSPPDPDAFVPERSKVVQWQLLQLVQEYFSHPDTQCPRSFLFGAQDMFGVWRSQELN